MSVARDIQELLNDGTLEISKRILLAQSFANTKRDNFPEKYQIVFDWICNFIATRNEDAVNNIEIWHLLRDLLHLKTGEIKFSNSFFDAICVGLAKVANGKEDEISFYVIDICREALKNDRFISTLNFKTAVYIHLLSVALQTVSEMKVRGVPHLEHAVDVLAQLLKLAKEICGKELDQEWVFDAACEEILKPAAAFAAAFSEDETYRESDLNVGFKKMIEDLFFNFSHVPSYDSMIKHLFGEAKTMNRNMKKFIACVRQSCLRRVGASETGAESGNPCRLLVVLYQSFLDRYHSRFPTSDKVRFLMIMLKINGIESFIGENPVINSDSCSSVENSESERLAIMEKLVRALSSKQGDLSVVVGSDELMTRLYKSLREALLNSFSTRPVSWFESLDALLDVNVAILRSALKKLLVASWLGVSQISGDVENAQVKFICHLVSIYVKLFQLPGFIEVMLAACPDATAANQKLPVQVIRVFRKGFEELPCGQILKIWKVLVTSINDTLSTKQFEKGKGNACLHMAVTLLHSLIRHMRLLELTMTPADVQLFEELLDVSFSQCMPHLLDLSLLMQDPHFTFLYLLLSRGFGDFVLLLGNYSPNYSAKISSQLTNFETKKSHWDLKCLHFYTESDKWKEVFAFVRSSEEPKLGYLAALLVLQKVEACVSFGDEECAELAADNAVKFFGKFPWFGHRRVASWNYEADDVDEANIHVAVWTAIALHLKQLVSYCSEDKLKAITNMIVDIIAMPKKNHKAKKKRLCPYMEAETLMSWDEITELSSLQTALVTCVVRNCLDLFSNKSFKGEQLLGILCSEPNTWLEFGNTVPNWKNDETPNEMWKSVAAASAVLLEIMKREDAKDVLTLDEQIDWTKFSSLLRVFELLPLRHLLPGNNIRIVYFLMWTMCSLAALADLEMRVELEVRCRKMLLSILDGQRQQFLFKFVRSSDVIDWMLRTFQNSISVDDHSLEEYEDSSARLVDDSVKLIARSGGYFKDLNDCITKFSEEKSREASQLRLTFIVAVLDGVKHAMKRFDHAPQKMVLFKTYFHASQGVLLVYAERLVENASSQRTHRQNMKIRHALFRGFAIILDHKCAVEPESIIALGNYLRAILQEALDVIKSGNFDDSSCDLIRISIANYDKLEEFLPEKFIRLVWQSVNGAKRTTSEGNSEITDETEAKEKSLNKLLEIICTCCSPQEFQKNILNESMESMGGSDFGDENLEKIDASVRIWLIILKMELDDEKWKYVKDTVSEVFSLTGDLLTFVFQNDLTPLNQTVAVNLLKLTVAMLSSFQNGLSTQELDLCLHGCMRCHLNDLEDPKTFSLFFTVIYEVCNGILKNHSRSARGIVPSFVSFIQYILSEMMKRSHQEKLQRSAENADLMHKCALNMERLFTLMSANKSFVNGAAHIVGKYVNDLPKATLLPIIKTTLTIGMQRLLAVCSREGLVLLRCNLKLGSKELFAQLYDDYVKYHKYQGKI